MCRHVLNAQVSVRAPCCRRWFDCALCHAELSSDHELKRTTELAMVCKSCRRAFRKDLEQFEVGSDDHCPHCDNCYVIEAETPTPDLSGAEPDARVDNSIHVAADPRMRFDPRLAFLAATGGGSSRGGSVGGLLASSSSSASTSAAQPRGASTAADALDGSTRIDAGGIAGALQARRAAAAAAAEDSEGYRRMLLAEAAATGGGRGAMGQAESVEQARFDAAQLATTLHDDDLDWS